LSDENEYGITSVTLNEEYRSKIESGAAPIQERIAAIRRLHDLGCRTWVSMEPYPTPNIIEQELDDILEEISFVDKIIFGRTNYSKEVTAYKTHRDFYNQKAQEVIDFCESRGIQYYIKAKTVTEG
jgi:DNA repair photolyase